MHPHAVRTLSRRERERIRLKDVDYRRRKFNWYNPAPVTQQRNHEYAQWLRELPYPRRDDEECDDSMATFVNERRARKEKERLQLVAQARKAQRQAVRAEKQRAALPTPSAPDPPLRKRGRPVDPNSKRQRALTAQRLEAEKQEQKKKEHADLCAAAARKQDAYVAHLQSIACELTCGMRQLGEGAASLLEYVGGEYEQGSNYYRMLLARVSNGGAVHWTDVRGSKHGCKWSQVDVDTWTADRPAVWEYREVWLGECAATLDLEREVASQPALEPCDAPATGRACKCIALTPRFKRRTMNAGEKLSVHCAPVSCPPVSEWPPTLRWDAEAACIVPC